MPSSPMRYLVPALHDLGDMLQGPPARRRSSCTRRAQVSCTSSGTGPVDERGSGLDMAAWDALAKAAQGAAMLSARRHLSGRMKVLQQQWPVAARLAGCRRARRSSCRRALRRPQAAASAREQAPRRHSPVAAVRKPSATTWRLMVRSRPGPRRERGADSAATASPISSRASIQEPLVYDNPDRCRSLSLPARPTTRG